MQRELQITFDGLPHSEVLDRDIREKVRKLDQINHRLIGGHVVVQAPPRHHNHGGRFGVSVNLKLPGSEISVNREAEDVYVAVRDAFDAAKRKLAD